MIRLCPFLSCLLMLVQTAFGAGVSPRAAERLKIHGIGQTEGVLVGFLTNGFASGVDYSAMPSEPGEKCQLLIDAMQVVGAKKMLAAYGPLERLARRDISPGLESMIQHDLLLTQPANRSERREEITRFLQYNAAVALSLLGDDRALPLMQTLFRGEENALLKTQYALGMACLGDASGMDYLLQEIERANQESSVAAAQAFYYVTGIDYGLRATSPVSLRKKLADDYTSWWEENKESLSINPQEIVQRRLAPKVAPRNAGKSVRDLIALSTNYADFRDALGSRSAEERLEKMGQSAAADIRTVAEDPMEDLVVRNAAIRRYVILKKDDSKKFLRGLQKDENPEVAAMAREMMELVESGRIHDYSTNTFQMVNPSTTPES